jgi:hypothetical protein
MQACFQKLSWHVSNFYFVVSAGIPQLFHVTTAENTFPFSNYNKMAAVTGSHLLNK